jgi:hypothetical protein
MRVAVAAMRVQVVLLVAIIVGRVVDMPRIGILIVESL